MKGKISITLNERVLRDIDGSIDGLYVRNRSQAIERLVLQGLGERKTAVILAGGPVEDLRVGAGFAPTTRVGKMTVVELAAKKLRESGFRHLVIVARHPVLTAIFSVLGDGAGFGISVTYVEEKASEGTADSLRLLRGRLSGSFLVVYSDILFPRISLEALWADHRRQGGIATIMLTTSAKPSEKGTVVMEGNKVLSFIQKPRVSDVYLVFSPIFCASDEIFDEPGSSLERQVFPQLAKKGLLFGHLSSQKESHVHSSEDVRRLAGKK
ncbi:MAG: sugar phosphate nucleotidyltransferase [Nanoarchaeota archaeon]